MTVPLAAEIVALIERLRELDGCIAPCKQNYILREAADTIERLCTTEAELRSALEAHEEVHADHRRLVRELDLLLNGSGAAKQASLCDIVSQLRRGGRVVALSLPDHSMYEAGRRAWIEAEQENGIRDLPALPHRERILSEFRKVADLRDDHKFRIAIVMSPNFEFANGNIAINRHRFDYDGARELQDWLAAATGYYPTEPREKRSETEAFDGGRLG